MLGLTLFLAVDKWHLTLPATDLRVLRAGRVFRSCRLYSGAVPHPCPGNRGLVLQRRGPRHNQFRAVGSRPLGAPFGGNFNKPAALMTCFALLSIYAMYLGRETRANPLPR